MNGEAFDRIVMPDSVDERDFKTAPSNFLPIYMGKWSKVICELRHRFGQDPDCGDGAGYKDLLSHPAERYNQPDVTQTQPKALEVSPHGEIIRAMKKINECFQTRSSPIDVANMNGETNGYEESDLSNEGLIDTKLDPNHDENHVTNPEKDIPETNRTETNGSAAVEELIDFGRYHEAKTLPRSDSTASTVKHKIYVDFITNTLLCEGCGEIFPTLDDAGKHWKDLDQNDTRDSVDIGCNTEKSEELISTNSSRDTSVEEDYRDLPIKTDDKEPGEDEYEKVASPSSEYKPPEVLYLELARQPADSEDVPDSHVKEKDNAETDENSNEENFDKPENMEKPDEKENLEKEPILINEKQNGGGGLLYGKSSIHEEKEFLIKEDRFSKKKKKDKKGKKKRKKNKPLKYIRRAFMYAVMFLF